MDGVWSMAGNSILSSAKAAKQDGFYTRLADIAEEVKHYKDHLRGKVVRCNCDDPLESDFFKYFAANSTRSVSGSSSPPATRARRSSVGDYQSSRSKV